MDLPGCQLSSSMGFFTQIFKDIAEKMLCRVPEEELSPTLEVMSLIVPFDNLIRHLKPSFCAFGVSILNSHRDEIIFSDIEIQVRGNLLVNVTEEMQAILDLHQCKCYSYQSYHNEVGLIHTDQKDIWSGADVRIIFETEQDTDRFVNTLSKFTALPKISRLKPLVTIGVGTFGFVMICQQDGQLYAVKQSKLTSSLKKHALSERLVLDRVTPCGFLVSTHALLRRGLHIYNIMEFCSGGDLFTLMSYHGQEIRKNSDFYASEILLALQHLHHHEILHRDLKPENVMVCANGHVKLGDFGLAKYVGENPAKTICGTESYLSPEVLNAKETGYSYSADFWQFACFVYELHAGHSPFEKLKNQAERRKAVRKACFDHGTNTPTTAKRLIDNILKVQIKDRKYWQRYDWDTLQRDKFFGNIDWKATKSRLVRPPIIPEQRNVKDNFDPECRNVPARLIDSSILSKPDIDCQFAGFNFHQAYPCMDSLMSPSY